MSLTLQLPPVPPPESAMLPGMAAPAPRTVAPPAMLPLAIPDTSIGPVALQEPLTWNYDFDPTTGSARATYPGGTVFSASQTISGNVAGLIGVELFNTSTANGAATEFGCTNDVPHYAVFGLTGSGFVGSADGAYLETNASGGLQILSDAGAPISVWIGSSEMLEVNTGGLALFNLPTVNPHVLHAVWADATAGFTLKLSQG